MNNPILEMEGLPPFQKILPEHVEEAIDSTLKENREELILLLEKQNKNWKEVIDPLEEMNDRLSQRWSPVSHLNAVMNNEGLRKAYNGCLPKLSEYATELGQNLNLFNIYKDISEGNEYQQLNEAQKKVVENALRDFRLSGINLDESSKKRYGEIKKRLSELNSKFSENVLDATQAWEKHIINEEELSGMPPSALDNAKQLAEQKNKSGFIINLEFPSYMPLMSYCDNRALRQEVHLAYVTRASELTSGENSFDNKANMNEILELRYELSTLLGFNNYAELSLATKMADSPDNVFRFLNELASRSLPFARREFSELQGFAKKIDQLNELEAWDIAYYSEKLRLEKYNVSQEELRPYFPAPKVLDGMFEIASRLYGIHIVANKEMEVWHKDVLGFDVKNKEGLTIARFYIDLFARENKRGGAWMDECKVRRINSKGSLQIPVAYLVCNFTAPVGDKPSLLTHNEVTTLFHEFGHGLHHMLTKVDIASVSGINGVAWDAVELPSQFMENWAWEPEAIPLFSAHYESGEALPEEKLEKLLAAKNFQAGMQMVRQLEFALFDFKIHTEYKPGEGYSIQNALNQVRDQVSVVPVAKENRFQNSFSHIFAGGYAAGYYSYKWAEVLSADAFSKFEEQGIFNAETGRSFKECILEKGGSAEPADLFKAFRGREPKVDALLKRSGFD